MNQPGDLCPKCGKNHLQQGENYISFTSGSSPYHSLSLKMRALWCPNSECDFLELITLPGKTGKIP
jgi:hypothetical protein